MTSGLRLLGIAAAAACVLLLATARCTPTGDGDDGGSCAPLDAGCGAAATCCSISNRGDPLTCDADAGRCVVQCLSSQHDCTDAQDSCCPGYSCVLDTQGYGKCQ
ncbi:MAG TPA: hypothetical protein VFA20_07475 [Myxococcaceae bacterium]|nr:hypothetical protein [Myxococcaceae bacterium]